MSGRVESPVPPEIGAPPLTSSKCAVLPLPTSRETNTCLTPPTCSSHATQGAVGVDGSIVPAATRGSSASDEGSLLSEHSASAAVEAAQLSLASSVPWAALPTATQWNSPFALTPSLTPFAANTSPL